MKKELYAQCIPYDKNIKGRIGGNPPINIETEIPEGYGFYATLVHPDDNDQMLSICIAKDFKLLLKNNYYPNVAIKVITHAYSPMGNQLDKSLEDFGGVKASISEYTNNKFEVEFIQVRGNPIFIQNKSWYWEQIEKDNYSYFLTINEEGYIDELNDILCFGAIYLYQHNETKKIIAGFWQRS
ncbi:hypothetical protein [Capnocytophaga granulosa]|jgi:hypothetical protein|uniref:hypothetical protein n=1 Tax=Capnocytophaga granulosa TaxID=45242 RepID=UPI0023EFD74D|nr:hypothetical protein [Capnocytophaga granulosa]